jgi:hypothetical protein
MKHRRVAYAVFRSTHPIHWTFVNGVLTSPSGTSVVVTIRRARFGLLVGVGPGGSYRSLLPWDWTHFLLSLVTDQQNQKEVVRNKLLATSFLRKPL